MTKIVGTLSKPDILFLIMIPIVLSPWVGGASALILGSLFANLGLKPQGFTPSRYTKKLLAISVVGLGFGTSIQQAIHYSQNSLTLIISSIVVTLTLGVLLGRWFKIDSKISYLISGGTAICGGSAIAALSPAIKADNDQSALALATVFMLNAVALFVFPVIGHFLSLSQADFGLWAAIAIHDTSSVVGAASSYGNEALAIATTVKLSRALWIVPLAFFSAFIFNRGKGKIVFPWFILYYILAMVAVSLLGEAKPVFNLIFAFAKELLGLCLFFIGYSITVERIKSAGVKPLLLGLSLWLFISVASLAWILLL